MVRNRSRFRKFISVTMLLAMILSFFSTTVLASGSDIKGHWAEKEINEWVDKGLVGGYKDGNFKPDASISRAEFIALVNRAFGFTESSETGFNDVSSKDWYYGEVLKAKAAGYIGGYHDGTIKPKNNINRQEVAAILSRLLKVENAADSVEQFKDKGSIPQWSKGVVGGIVAQGLMKGFKDGTFKPLNNTTRAEAVVILNRALKDVNLDVSEKVYDTAGTYGPADGLETVKGNVVVTADDVTLRNMVIEGDLTIAEEVGDGEVYLKGVTVKGKTYVNGGGENSIHFEDTVLLTVIVNKADGTVRIIATGSTTVQEVTLQSSAKVEQTGTEGVAFKAVTLAETLPANSQVTLIGNFETVDILATSIAVQIPRGSIQDLKVNENAKGNNINLAKDAKIVSMVLDAAVKVLGQGVIENSKGKQEKESTFANPPKNSSSNQGVGGGGGGNNSSNDDSTSDDEKTTLPKNSGTITLEYLGHSAFILTTSEKKILIDPWDPKDFGLPNYQIKNQQEINLITLTHQHTDHNFTDAAPSAKAAGQIVQGVTLDEEHVQSFNEIKDVIKGDVKLNNINLPHFPDGPEFEWGADQINTGLIYETANMRIVDMGDAMGPILEGLSNEQKNNLKGSNGIDILIIPVGDWKGEILDSDSVIKAIHDLNPKVVIPVHAWNTKNEFLTEVGKDKALTIQNKESLLTIKKDDLPSSGTVIWNMSGTFDKNAPFIDPFIILIEKGSTPNSTQFDLFIVGEGNSLMTKVQNEAFSIPEVGSNVPEGATPYTSGEDIIGVIAGNHVGLYEVNGSGKVVKFIDITLKAEDISPVAPDDIAPTLEKIITLDIDDSDTFEPGKDGFQVVFSKDIHIDSQEEINRYLETNDEMINWIGTKEDGMEFQWLDNKTLQVKIGTFGLFNIGAGDSITIPKELVYDENSVTATDVTITLSKPASFPPKFDMFYPDAVTGINEGELNLSVDLDEVGKVYYVVVPNGSDKPSVEQIKAGINYNSVTVSASGTIAVDDSETVVENVVTGLTAGDRFDVYFVAEDNELTPNIQTDRSEVIDVKAKIDDLYIVRAETYDEFRDGTIDHYIVITNHKILDNSIDLTKITINGNNPEKFITGYSEGATNDNMFWLQFEAIDDTGALPDLILEEGAFGDVNGRVMNIAQPSEDDIEVDVAAPTIKNMTTNDSIQLDLTFSEPVVSIEIDQEKKDLSGQDVSLDENPLGTNEAIFHFTSETGNVQNGDSFIFTITDAAGNEHIYNSTFNETIWEITYLDL